MKNKKQVCEVKLYRIRKNGKDYWITRRNERHNNTNSTPDRNHAAEHSSMLWNIMDDNKNKNKK